MHRQLLAYGASLLLLPLPSIALPSVSGSIKLIDEHGNPWSRFSLTAFVDVHFVYITAEDEIVDCPGRGEVGSENWEFLYLIPESCQGRDLTASIAVRPAIDWKLVPPPASLRWDDEAEEYSLGTLQILRPRTTSRTTRQAYLEAGEERLTSDPQIAVAYFAEAARGHDYEFTARAANTLEGNGMQSAVYALFAGKDISALPIPDGDKFQFAMRKANAARAAGESMRAVEAYAEAQKFNPGNPYSLAFAYTTIRQDVDARNAEDLAAKLTTRQSLWEGFTEIFRLWQPRSGRKPEVGIRAEVGALRFAERQTAAVATELGMGHLGGPPSP